MDFLEKIESELVQLKSSEQLRSLRETATLPNGNAMFNGEIYANFSGNDYLGLAGDLELKREFYNSIAEELPVMAATGSRLLGGTHAGFTQLEQTLSESYGRSALVFNSGYHANIGILPALTSRDSVVLSDKLNHASIIDGLRLCEGEFKRYKHLDYDHLESLLQSATQSGKQPFIITESIFSMDGDVADLVKIVQLKKQYNAVLVVDEAHSVGVCGVNGLGLCHQLNLLDDVDIMVGTFGKAFGSTGAYCITSELYRDYLINKMRSFIFSTALPPIVTLWSNFIFKKQLEMDFRRQNLRKLSGNLRQLISDRGYKTLGDSQIVPLIVGENAPAMAMAEKFRAEKLLVFAVRPPTVPKGSSRLRFSLTAASDESIIARIDEVLK